MHHHIVAPEGIHVPMPDFQLVPPHTSTLTVYQTTSPSELHTRIRDATIIIATTVRLDSVALSVSVTPHLRLVAVMATGTDHIDLDACRARGIWVTNTPLANIDAVSEHAVSLYFASRRKTAMLDALTKSVPSPWKEKRSVARLLRNKYGEPPLTCRDEVAGLLGYGNLGKRIGELCAALGMRVLVAGRKGGWGSGRNGLEEKVVEDVQRIPFEEVLRNATVLFIALPRNKETENLVSTRELGLMSSQTVIINISRGGIMDEAAVVEALREGQIAGVGTDVFAVEPAEGGKDSPLLDESARHLNITVSPHVAWCAGRTLRNLQRILKDTVEAWAGGNAINVIVEGRA